MPPRRPPSVSSTPTCRGCSGQPARSAPTGPSGSPAPTPRSSARTRAPTPDRSPRYRWLRKAPRRLSRHHPVPGASGTVTRFRATRSTRALRSLYGNYSNLLQLGRWNMTAVDLHQHLWPEPFVELLRRRSSAPYLRGWTLVTEG